MTTHSRTTAAELVAEAKQHVENLTPARVAAELVDGDRLVVDLREPAERTEQGIIEGAVHVPRGMLSSMPTRPAPITAPSSSSGVA